MDRCRYPRRELVHRAGQPLLGSPHPGRAGDHGNSSMAGADQYVGKQSRRGAVPPSSSTATITVCRPPPYRSMFTTTRRPSRSITRSCRRISTSCLDSARLCVQSIRTWCSCRSVIRSVGSSITTSPCSTSASSAPTARRRTTIFRVRPTSSSPIRAMCGSLEQGARMQNIGPLNRIVKTVGLHPPMHG